MCIVPANHRGNSFETMRNYKKIWLIAMHMYEYYSQHLKFNHLNSNNKIYPVHIYCEAFFFILKHSIILLCWLFERI